MATTQTLWLTDVSTVAVMSDLHLGADNCVLEKGSGGDPLDRDGTFWKFLATEIGQVDTFVLLGDVYELALSTYDRAVPRVTKLLAAISELCSTRIVIVPGNHDHYVWTLTRDQKEIIERFPQYPAAFFPTQVHSFYPSTWWTTEVAYPNVYWNPPASDKRSFIFHHGHYCSDTYTLVSDFYRDLFDGQVSTIDQIEGINSGWLDLVWYHLGQSGPGIGGKGLVDQIYEDIRKNGESPAIKKAADRFYKLKISPAVRNALHAKADDTWWLTHSMADLVANQLDSRVPGWIESAVRAYALHEAGNDRRGMAAERGMALDDELVAHCDRYVATTVLSEPGLRNRDLSMIFGHTHVHGVATGKQSAYSNTGGWVLGANGEWPDSFVFRIAPTGDIAMKKYVV